MINLIILIGNLKSVLKRNFVFLVLIISICPSLIYSQTSIVAPPINLVELSIEDFSKGGALLRQDSVFIVSARKLVKYEKLIAINISRSSTKILITSEAKIGSFGKVPSRYIEKNGKLYFWWDDTYPLTKETLDIFSKFNLLVSDENGILKGPEYRINKTSKTAAYYYCINNFSRFKKVITKIATGFYNPPKLKCK